jgi:hypothetical protein
MDCILRIGKPMHSIRRIPRIGKPMHSTLHSILCVAVVLAGGAAVAGWDMFGGEWAQAGKRITQTKVAAETCFSIYNGAVFEDFRAEVEITLHNTPDHWMSAGLAFRWIDQSNWTGCYISAGPADSKLQVTECKDGTQTYPLELACRYPITPERKYRLRVEARGDILNCYLDDRLMVVCRVTRRDKGRVGLMCFDSDVEFDRFNLQALHPDKRLKPYRDPLDPLGGKITPAARPYSEVLAKVAEFARSDKGKGGIRSEEGKPVPPYLFHAVINADDTLTYEASYPAFHHALFIKGFLNYYTFTGYEEWLHRAEQLADWSIAHSTPSSWVYGNLPYSTAYRGKPGGFVDADTIMVDKPAFTGEMYVRLWEATGRLEYLTAATKIAETLKKTQLEDGRWHFRVKPEDGTVVEDYTSNAIFAVRLFEALGTKAGATGFAQAKDKALLWLVRGPVRNGDWRDFYEDVGVGTNSVGNWDAIETARYLVEHRGDNPAYLTTAESIFYWVSDRFLTYQENRGPGLLEQTACMIPMQVHTGHWASLAAELGTAMRDKSYVEGAISALNLTTANLGDDGRGPTNVFTTGGSEDAWYSLSFSPLIHVPELMGALPILAPDGEDHILRYSCQPREIRYQEKRIEYRTARAAEETLKLSFEPASVTCDGKDLEKGGIGRGSSKWDGEQRLLSVSHAAGRVVVTGP